MTDPLDPSMIDARAAGIRAGRLLAAQMAAFTAVGVSAGRVLEQFTTMVERAFRPRPRRPASFTPRHAFTVGSFDLVCRVCGAGPEDCRGGRP